MLRSLSLFSAYQASTSPWRAQLARSDQVTLTAGLIKEAAVEPATTERIQRMIDDEATERCPRPRQPSDHDPGRHLPARSGRGRGRPRTYPGDGPLGPVDLATLDLLITTGIADSRAEGARWALARICEQPAYAQVGERARELDELKAHF
jgi:hypothetical protein